MRVEDKIVSFAQHYREAPELAPAVEQAAHAIAATLDGAFEVQEGAMVREIKPVTTNKGMAATSFNYDTLYAADSSSGTAQLWMIDPYASLFFPLGMLFGLALTIWLVIYRYGRS